MSHNRNELNKRNQLTHFLLDDFLTQVNTSDKGYPILQSLNTLEDRLLRDYSCYIRNENALIFDEDHENIPFEDISDKISQGVVLEAKAKVNARKKRDKHRDEQYKMLVEGYLLSSADEFFQILEELKDDPLIKDFEKALDRFFSFRDRVFVSILLNADVDNDEQIKKRIEFILDRKITKEDYEYLDTLKGLDDILIDFKFLYII